MSISTDNRKIALKAHNLFSRDILEEEGVKNYANAVEKVMLLLGNQGLKRTVLYITSQMGKEELNSDKDGDQNALINNPKAFRLLYKHLAKLLSNSPNLAEDRFQYWVIKECSKEKIALLEARAAFFLICLKRLAKSQIINDQDAPSEKEKKMS